MPPWKIWVAAALGMVMVGTMTAIFLANRSTMAASSTAVSDFLSMLGSVNGCGGYVGPYPQRPCQYRTLLVSTVETDDHLGVRFTEVDVYADALRFRGAVGIPQPKLCPGPPNSSCTVSSDRVPRLWDFEMFLATIDLVVEPVWDSPAGNSRPIPACHGRTKNRAVKLCSGRKEHFAETGKVSSPTSPRKWTNRRRCRSNLFRKRETPEHVESTLMTVFAALAHAITD
jgi:hypothetical protein